METVTWRGCLGRGAGEGGEGGGPGEWAEPSGNCCASVARSICCTGCVVVARFTGNDWGCVVVAGGGGFGGISSSSKRFISSSITFTGSDTGSDDGTSSG